MIFNMFPSSENKKNSCTAVELRLFQEVVGWGTPNVSVVFVEIVGVGVGNEVEFQPIHTLSEVSLCAIRHGWGSSVKSYVVI